MSLSLSAAPDPWADDDDGTGTELGLIRWAAETAGTLAGELTRLAADVGAAAEARRLWGLPGHPYACTGGDRLHTRDCGYLVRSGRAMAANGNRPLTQGQAEAWLRASHERRCCQVCQPGIPEAPWVRVRAAGGRVRWRLADDVELP